MAKRFADTRLSRESWYRRLSPAFKAAWRFLTDECDQAGCWSIDMDSMEFHVGERIDLEAFLGAVNAERDELKGERITRLDSSKIFINGFVEFQYGKLSEDCKPHKPVIERLKKLNLWKGYSKGFETLQEKEKEKEKEEGGVGETNPPKAPHPTLVSDSRMDPRVDDFRKILEIAGLSKTDCKKIAPKLVPFYGDEMPDFALWLDGVINAPTAKSLKAQNNLSGFQAYVRSAIRREIGELAEVVG